MFTINHFIWLAMVAVYIAILLFVSEKWKVSYPKVCIFMCIASFLSEMSKVASEMEPGEGGGMHLAPGALPFHLCSMQIFFIIASTVIKNERIKRILLLFMFPTMIIGASLALLIPTCGVEFDRMRIYEFFFFHGTLIFFSIYLLKRGFVDMGWKDLFRNYIFMFFLAMFGLWVNSALSVYDTNFLYLTRPPMDNLPLLNLDNGWYVYVVTLVGIGAVLLTAVQLPIVLYYEKKRKQKDEDI